MIEESTHKGLLLEDFRRHKALAEKYRERNQLDRAAVHYRKGAQLLEQISELESNEQLQRERAALATNFRNAAKTLKRRASEESTTPPNVPEDGSDTPDTPSGAPEKTGAGTDGAGANRPGKDGNGERDPSAFLEESPDLDFDDVGGMSELKQTLIDKVVDPLERPELYEEYDLGVVNGILLHGPPGTGKTYVTRALAGKLGYNFISVTPTDITSSLVGQAADNVASLFQVARENQPCLVFVDEIDAIAGDRDGGVQKTQSERQMVNQLLTELSAIQGEDVVVVAATNLLDAVDDAIQRSGRFDERIEVPPPDGSARVAILRVHLRSRPVLTGKIEWERIKELTAGYSASDVELIASNAARRALQEAREADEIKPITQYHLEEAIDETESSLTDWPADA